MTRRIYENPCLCISGCLHTRVVRIRFVSRRVASRGERGAYRGYIIAPAKRTVDLRNKLFRSVDSFPIGVGRATTEKRLQSVARRKSDKSSALQRQRALYETPVCHYDVEVVKLARIT